MQTGNAMDYVIEEKRLPANDTMQIHLCSRRRIFAEVEERLIFMYRAVVLL